MIRSLPRGLGSRERRTGRPAGRATLPSSCRLYTQHSKARGSVSRSRPSHGCAMLSAHLALTTGATIFLGAFVQGRHLSSSYSCRCLIAIVVTTMYCSRSSTACHSYFDMISSITT